jgi:hypothetical protein
MHVPGLSWGIWDMASWEVWEQRCSFLNLLSVPLTISLICYHIKSFRRASSCGEAMARRRK